MDHNDVQGRVSQLIEDANRRVENGELTDTRDELDRVTAEIMALSIYKLRLGTMEPDRPPLATPACGDVELGRRIIKEVKRHGAAGVAVGRLRGAVSPKVPDLTPLQIGDWIEAMCENGILEVRVTPPGSKGGRPTKRLFALIDPDD